MGQEPHQIRQEIEATRRQMGTTLDQIEDRVSPSRIVQRRTDKVRGAVRDVRERVMGVPDDIRSAVSDDQGRSPVQQASEGISSAASTVGSGVHSGAQSLAEGVQSGVGTVAHGAQSLAEGVQSGVGTIADGVQQAPQAVRQRTQGNPLAAGVIAFGVGLLAGSLLPQTKQEQAAASTLKEALQPVAEELGSAGQEVVSELKEEAQHAVEATKETAAEAASAVKDETVQAAQTVAEEGRERAIDVTDEVSRS
jgi:uncharacterized phage infection (PIP) family protein YhgE